VVPYEGARHFVYGVRLHSHRLPIFSPAEMDDGLARHEARTFFGDGIRGYDVMGFNREQIIGDVLAQFDRYLALVKSPGTQLYATAPNPT
jgi:choline/glycine/proline betaine transport protein